MLKICARPRSTTIQRQLYFSYIQVGKDLNFDEIVVYKEQAALPTHLVVYSLL